MFNFTAIPGMFNSVASGLASLKSLKDPKGRDDEISRLLSEIVALKTAFHAAQEEYASAKKQIADLNDFTKEKSRYERQWFEPGVSLYKLKETEGAGEHPEEICADCYNNNRKSLLYVTSKGNGVTSYKCNGCGATFDAGTYTPLRGKDTSRGKTSWMAE